MSKKKPVPYISAQEDAARETILGLRKPKPFAELTDPEKIMVLCVQLKQLRGQFSSLRADHHQLVHQFQKHQHFDGQVVMELNDIRHMNHIGAELGASEFDPLR